VDHRDTDSGNLEFRHPLAQRFARRHFAIHQHGRQQALLELLHAPCGIGLRGGDGRRNDARSEDQEF
jgi:hypothetical protein